MWLLRLENAFRGNTWHYCSHWSRLVRQYVRSFWYCVPPTRNSHLRHPIRWDYSLDPEFGALSAVVTKRAGALDAAMFRLESVVHIGWPDVVLDLPVCGDDITILNKTFPSKNHSEKNQFIRQTFKNCSFKFKYKSWFMYRNRQKER